MASDYLSISDAADELTQTHEQTIRPRWISDLFYLRELRGDLCPIVGGRRLIPRDYLPMIAMALRRRGWVAQSKGMSSEATLEPPENDAPREISGHSNREQVNRKDQRQGR
jgi:hypothetical protein